MNDINCFLEGTELKTDIFFSFWLPGCYPQTTFGAPLTKSIKRLVDEAVKLPISSNLIQIISENNSILNLI